MMNKIMVTLLNNIIFFATFVFQGCVSYFVFLIKFKVTIKQDIISHILLY